MADSGQSITNAQQAVQDGQHRVIERDLEQYQLRGLGKSLKSGEYSLQAAQQLSALNAQYKDRGTTATKHNPFSTIGKGMTAVRTGATSFRLLGTSYDVPPILQRGLKSGMPFLVELFMLAMLLKFLMTFVKGLKSGEFLSENFRRAKDAFNDVANKHGVNVKINYANGNYDVALSNKDGKPLSEQQYQAFMADYSVALIGQGLKPNTVDGFSFTDKETTAALSVPQGPGAGPVVAPPVPPVGGPAAGGGGPAGSPPPPPPPANKLAAINAGASAPLPSPLSGKALEPAGAAIQREEAARAAALAAASSDIPNKGVRTVVPGASSRLDAAAGAGGSTGRTMEDAARAASRRASRADSAAGSEVSTPGSGSTGGSVSGDDPLTSPGGSSSTPTSGGGGGGR